MGPARVSTPSTPSSVQRRRSGTPSDPSIDGQSEAWDAQEVDAERGDRASAGGWGSIVGDFNGDGVLDIYLPNGGPDTLWLGDGRGGWHPGPTLPTRTLDTTTAGTAADIDGDGDLDLLLASSLPQYILENQGDATFVVREFLGVSELGFTVAAADVDGDGDPGCVAGRLCDPSGGC